MSLAFVPQHQRGKAAPNQATIQKVSGAPVAIFVSRSAPVKCHECCGHGWAVLHSFAYYLPCWRQHLNVLFSWYPHVPVYDIFTSQRCHIFNLTFKAHLHYIWDLGPSIRVKAWTQSKQVNWCFVFTLIRVRVPDFCLGRRCPSSSLHVAISSDADVRVRPRLWNAHAQSRLIMWLLPNLVQNGRGLWWPRIRASDIV